jgi:hypothetical protein
MSVSLCECMLQTEYTGCPVRNVPEFGGRVLMLMYADITKNTCVQSLTVTEKMVREMRSIDMCYTLVHYPIILNLAGI